jgi:ferrous iron transport protein A
LRYATVFARESLAKGSVLMPLTLAPIGEGNIIKRIGGNAEVKKHLSDLGFVPGGEVRVISMLGGNVIVSVKESRIAISREMAMKIMV